MNLKKEPTSPTALFSQIISWIWIIAFAGVLHSCSGGAVRISGSASAGMDSGDNGSIEQTNFQPLTASKYTRKVKMILTGEAPTPQEIFQVTSDPSTFKDLVSTWIKSPAYQKVMLDFLTVVFQQNNITSDKLAEQYFTFAFPDIDPRLLQNISESFGRTALEIVNEGRPFTETMTTQRFMLTPPMMMFMALADTRQTHDNGSPDEDVFYGANPNFTQFILTPEDMRLSDSLDPENPNYLTFYSRQLANSSGACHQPLTVTRANNSIYGGFSFSTDFYNYLARGTFGVNSCLPMVGSDVVSDDDYTAWRMVTIEQPSKDLATGKPTPTTTFFQYPEIKELDTMVLTTPRVGFYTTLAFFDKWDTNASNQFRLTMNQALIVALGQAFDGDHGAMSPGTNPALDLTHASPGTSCYSCHITLDPMRQYFRQEYTLFFAQQIDTSLTNIPGYFAFDNVSAAGTGISDLGAHFAVHPDFAQAWTQKLCTWATSAPCLTNDPDFQHLVSIFKESNFSWNTLVVEMFSSPLVTYATETQTQSESGGTYPVAKRQQLCTHLAVALGIEDPCGLDETGTVNPIIQNVTEIAQILPYDEYGRGSTTPNQANDPGLFFRAGVENACLSISELAVDGSATKGYNSSDPYTAIADMVHNVMAMPPPDDAVPIGILTQHYQDVLSRGDSPVSALRSAFVISCLAPTTIGIGQ